MATGTIKINKVKSASLGTSNISTSSGTVASGSGVKYSYDDNYISISYYIRLKDTYILDTEKLKKAKAK